jgi:predicted aminopeptidase
VSNNANKLIFFAIECFNDGKHYDYYIDSIRHFVVYAVFDTSVLHMLIIIGCASFVYVTLGSVYIINV